MLLLEIRVNPLPDGAEAEKQGAKDASIMPRQLCLFREANKKVRSAVSKCLAGTL